MECQPTVHPVHRPTDIIRRIICCAPMGRLRLWRLLAKAVVPSGHPHFVGRFHNLLMEVRPDCPISLACFLYGFAERGPAIWLKHFLSGCPGGIILDVGANIGSFSLLSCAFGGNRVSVHALEPDPWNADWLDRNIALNPALPVQTHRLAASNLCGRAGFTLGRPSAGNAVSSGWSRFASANLEGEIIEVPTVTLDEFCNEQQIAQCELVKIDVEGAEGMVIDGMQRGLSTGRYRRILLELHQGSLLGDYSEAGLFRLMLSHGYRASYIPRFTGQSFFQRFRHCRLAWDPTIMRPIQELPQTAEPEHFLFEAPG